MHTDRFHLAAPQAPPALRGPIQWESLIRKVLRTFQINVPFLQDFRFSLQRLIRFVTDTTVEPDFDALRIIPGLNNALAIDVGANRGDTIQAIQMRTRNTKVMAFEPNPLIFSRLHRIYKNRDDVKLFNFGLSNRDEIVTLHVPFYKQFMFDGLASFDIKSALSWLNGRIFFYDEKYLSLRNIDCCLTRLDRFELSPAFIKVDVQGFEHQVLTGAIDTIRRCRPVILTETPGPDVVELMEELDYLPYSYSGERLVPGFGELNTFFIAAEKAHSISTRDASRS
jgi:FkbM family methyltransferase